MQQLLSAVDAAVSGAREVDYSTMYAQCQNVNTALSRVCFKVERLQEHFEDKSDRTKQNAANYAPGRPVFLRPVLQTDEAREVVLIQGAQKRSVECSVKGEALCLGELKVPLSDLLDFQWWRESLTLQRRNFQTITLQGKGVAGLYAQLLGRAE